jgi:hypothetical protein
VIEAPTLPGSGGIVESAGGGQFPVMAAATAPIENQRIKLVAAVLILNS